MNPEEAIVIDSGGLRLEARLRHGEWPISLVMLHPHPAYGGNMHSPVVTAVCEAVGAAGASTLRLNFRGVEGSEGAYANGVGEADDAVAAVAAMRERFPGQPVALGGYSFGGMVAALASPRVRPNRLVLVSPVGFGAWGLEDDVRSLILGGRDDALLDIGALEAAASPALEVVVVPNVDHFWYGATGILGEHAVRFVTGE